MKLKKMVVIIALNISSAIVSFEKQGQQQSIYVDSMVDFRYPVSVMEQVHTNLAQILYSLEFKTVYKGNSTQEVLDTSMETLQEVDDLLVNKHNIKPEDVDFLQSMIDRIDSLIEHLEGEDSRVQDIHTMCASIKDKLS